ncbi:MBL fold metallo-hydrolase [Nonomuraea soli]|uniref:Glyoxylase-like metal-dependent hydrolase (Beta-lactamase superfamily II) n=1 Tax=Nonomuraea soli TaxID=1032476 RepID=A0A7W0CID3_9ACTN|nr:MBL fold metallo-hydrolase [Nonomuraea soli]MBA2891500.1 glyoxylase-like metal-dependent hydrolase (beta-lactamase superfamily II) [Nonomuraea soli]
MPYESRKIGTVEITPLCDAVGPMGPSLRRPFQETFLGAPHDEGEWILHFHCYLLRGDEGHVTLVDTGIGPASDWAPAPGHLLSELAAAGVEPGDVDTVIITHMHSDHYGGTVIDGKPVFRNARHIVQAADPNPLGELMTTVDGDAEVAPGVWVRHTPGHTPGHQIVETGEFTLAADILHHPVQLADPTIRYVHDHDADLASRARIALVERLRAERRLLGTAHFAEPFIQLGE